MRRLPSLRGRVPAVAALWLAMMLAAPAMQRAEAQGQDCTCIGLGKVTLRDSGAGPGTGDSPIRYQVPAAPELPGIDARISISCRPGSDEATECMAEVQAAITGGGDSRLGDGSGRSTAPAPACLVAGEALGKAWAAAVGEARPGSAPVPCS
ncbi:hypothetical protein ACFOGJ_05145 [Marinibaculum pumilum]|uniref:Secreted protein n=1 Tax=Marinibaculum pumilum TaxID=1766165 RepID=A0ABV7KWQ4_9PROT